MKSTKSELCPFGVIPVATENVEFCNAHFEYVAVYHWQSERG